MSRLNLPVIVLFLASILWGLSWWPLKALNGLGIDGLPLLFICHGLLTIIFGAMSWHHLAYVKQNLFVLSAIALFGGAAVLSFNYALIYGNVVRVMVLFYLLPVWGVIGGIFFLNEASSMARWLGVALAVIGAFLVLGGAKIFDQAPTIIDLIALAAGMLFAANNLLFRGVERAPLMVKIWFVMLGCSALSGLLLLTELQKFPASLPPSTWFWIFTYAAAWVFFANLGSLWAVSKMEAGRSSIILIMELVTAVISSLIIVGERLSLVEWLGCAAIVSAAMIEALKAEA